jgi:hypothetical protein
MKAYKVSPIINSVKNHVPAYVERPEAICE